jgi:MFS family permease
MRLLVGAIVINLAVAASLGPILGFFTVSTTSYPFMVLLNVVLLGIGGAIGLSFLLRTLRALAEAERRRRVESGAAEEEPPIAPVPPPILTDSPYPRPVRRPLRDPGLESANFIFRVWIIIYALVGAQMGWVLRPFIGSPDVPFTFFRDRSGHFFSAVWNCTRSLMGF